MAFCSRNSISGFWNCMKEATHRRMKIGLTTIPLGFLAHQQRYAVSLQLRIPRYHEKTSVPCAGARGRVSLKRHSRCHTSASPGSFLPNRRSQHGAVLRHNIPAFFLHICVARVSTGNRVCRRSSSGHGSPGHRHANHDHRDVLC